MLASRSAIRPQAAATHTKQKFRPQTNFLINSNNLGLTHELGRINSTVDTKSERHCSLIFSAQNSLHFFNKTESSI